MPIMMTMLSQVIDGYLSVKKMVLLNTFYILLLGLLNKLNIILKHPNRRNVQFFDKGQMCDNKTAL